MRLLARTAASTFKVFAGDDAPRFEIGVDARGRIETVWPSRPANSAVAQAPLVTPGLVDLQVNGFAGVDFNAPNLQPAAFEMLLLELLACGVTRFLPTLITASEDDLCRRLDTLDRVVADSPLGQHMVMGYHVEGPFLSNRDGYAGCHPAHAMTGATAAILDRFLQNRLKPVRILTVAPEVPGVIDLIPLIRSRGIACSIGHTAADPGTIRAAVDAGATISTHLGNGLPHVLSKNENPLFSQLGEDRLFAGFIADGHHIAPDTLRSWLRAKTLSRSFLVSDAAAAAGPNTHEGLYTIGAAQIERTADGLVRIPGSEYLAGSSTWMAQMVGNLMRWFGFGWDPVLRLCRVNPLHAIGETRTVPAVGDWADFVEWTDDRDKPTVGRVHVGSWILDNTP